MSILIKGMAKPRNCDACFFYTEKCGGICRISDGNVCPIVEVPPHGRLIDVDRIGLTDFEIIMCNGDFKEALKMLLDKINSAPTVIPAEEADNG